MWMDVVRKKVGKNKELEKEKRTEKEKKKERKGSTYNLRDDIPFQEEEKLVVAD